MLELRHSYPSQLSSGPLSTLVLWPLHQKPQPLSQLLWLAHQTASDWLAQELHEPSGE
jgi:hypothetical protein